MKYKLLCTLYTDKTDDDVFIEDINDFILFAKKGMIFELLKLTEDLRKNYNAFDEEDRYIFLHKNGKYILSENKNVSYFELIK